MGLHHCTNITKKRGAHTRIHWVLASVRYKKVLLKAKKFMRDVKQRVVKVIDFEYKNYKRILQTDLTKNDGARDNLRPKLSSANSTEWTSKAAAISTW